MTAPRYLPNTVASGHQDLSAGSGSTCTDQFLWNQMKNEINTLVTFEIEIQLMVM